jgi:metallo-beta-lactamase family protein
MINLKNSVRLLILTTVLVAAIVLSAFTATQICELRSGYDQTNVTASGYVNDLQISDNGYANFDVTDGLCQVHVYWNFPGSAPDWLDDGVYVQVNGNYEQYNSIYKGPEIIASQVVSTAKPITVNQTADTATDWTIIPWGAAGEVAGSCYQLTTPSASVLVDCGSFMNYNDMPSTARGDILDCDRFPFDPHDISAVLITHAHDDHTGRLHYLVAYGFTGPIYMTHATAQIYKKKLDDTLRYSCLPDMDEDDARDEMRGYIEDMLVTYGYLEPFEATKGISATFVDAGHIPGSASIVVETDIGEQVETIVFSGDLGSGHHPFLNAPDTEYLSTVTASTVIVESTYGASGPREYPDDLYANFYNAVQSELDHHRLVVIPAFALDRTQRVLAALIESVDTGRLNIAKPIGVGGKSSYYLTLEYMEMQADQEQFEQYFSDDFFNRATFAGQGSTWDFVRKSISDFESETPENARNFSVIVTPSGTGSSSYARRLIDEYGESDKVTFLQVGWVPDWSPLGEIIDSGRVVSIPEVTNVFSGHADISGLVEYVGAFPNLESVIITHGDDPLGARAGLESAIFSKFSQIAVLRPGYGQVIDLLHPELGHSCADTRFCSSTDCVSASSAAEYKGTELRVCGVVAGGRRLDNGRTFLNLGRPYPNQDFTIMIEPSRIAAFDSVLGSNFERNLVGSVVCAYGLVSDYEGTCQIVPKEPWQIWSTKSGTSIPEQCRCEQ